jgi:hypothetical protein
VTIYGMPPDDPSSLIPENTIDADSQGAFEQHGDKPHDEPLATESDEVDDTERPES